MALPPPPGYKPQSNRQPRTAPDQAPEPSMDVDEDVTAFIIRTTLIPVHRTDPNVLRFIDRYMMCREARQAAREVGLPPQAGPNLLRKHDIHDCISKLTQKLVMKYGFDASEVVERVKEVAGIDPAELLNKDGSYKKLQDIPAEIRRGIKKMKVKNSWTTDPNGIKVIDGEILEIEFWDKMKAVELLGREKNLFKESKVVTHDVGSNMRNILLESKDRATKRIDQMRDVIQIGESNGEEENNSTD